MAFSLASAPPSVKKKVLMGSGISEASRLDSLARDGVAAPGKAYMTPSAASFIAATTLGCECPMFTLISCELKSIHFSPLGP